MVKLRVDGKSAAAGRREGMTVGRYGELSSQDTELIHYKGSTSIAEIQKSRFIDLEEEALLGFPGKCMPSITLTGSCNQNQDNPQG